MHLVAQDQPCLQAPPNPGVCVPGDWTPMVSEGDLNPETRAFSPILRLYAGGGEIPCSRISCTHASGRASARVKLTCRFRHQCRRGHGRRIRCGLPRPPRAAGSLTAGPGTCVPVQSAPRSADPGMFVGPPRTSRLASGRAVAAPNWPGSADVSESVTDPVA